MTINVLSIPDEILDLVFAMIVEGGAFWALRACTLVCRRWNAASRPHLFHTKTIQFLAPYTKRFLEHTFHAFRDLPPYVKYLRLVLPGSRNISLPDGMLRRFELFSGIRSLYLGGVGKSTDQQVTISEMLAILASVPSLERLQLKDLYLDDGFAHLTALLKLCSKTLLHLSLEANVQKRFDDDEKLHIFVNEQVDMRALQTLDLLLSYPGAKALLGQRFIRCPNLREYTARLPMSHDRPNISLLPIFIESDLDVFTLTAKFPSPYLQLKNAAHISQLNLHVQSRYYSYQDLFNWIKDFIMALPFPLSLRGITLNLRVSKLQGSTLPSAANFQFLVDALHHLVENGALTFIDLDLSIKFAAEWGDNLAECRDRALSEIQKGFSILSSEGACSITHNVDVSFSRR